MIERIQNNDGQMLDRVTFTHKGMYGLCPIYLEMETSNGEAIVERSRLFTPLLWLTDFLFFNVYQPIHEAKYGEIAPFCFKVTGKLKKPVVQDWLVRDE